MDTDEYGNVKPSNTAGARYGWLGAKQRSNDTLGDLTLMGVRFYSSALGRFLSVDPVPGGSAHSYEYASQDPVNNADLDGRKICSRWNLNCKAKKHWKDAASVLGMAIPCTASGPLCIAANAAVWAYSSYKDCQGVSRRWCLGASSINAISGFGRGRMMKDYKYTKGLGTPEQGSVLIKEVGRTNTRRRVIGMAFRRNLVIGAAWQAGQGMAKSASW